MTTIIETERLMATSIKIRQVQWHERIMRAI